MPKLLDNLNAATVGDLFVRSWKQWSHKTAIQYAIGSITDPLSYNDLKEKVKTYVSALNGLGLVKGDRLAICSENCFEWALVDWASLSLGIIIVPIYPTLPLDQVEHIIRDSGSKILLIGDFALAQKAKHISHLKIFLLKPGQEYQDIGTLAINAPSLNEDQWLHNMQQIKSEDLATIIYTSGTTGTPKGVMITHEAILFTIKSLIQTLPINENYVFLSFLPLSHVYERIGGHFLPIASGASLGYVQSVATFAKDMMEVKPTIMLCVPRFLESMRHRIYENVAHQSFIKRKLFALAYKQGLAKSQQKFAPFAKVLDKLVSQKIRERTGGRIEMFVSGSAALSKHVADFFTAFGVKIIQGYGLTETCAATTLNHPDRNRCDSVGEVVPGVKLKIASDGEILVSGPSLMKGYYNLPKETAEAIDSEGWFHTGDIGEFDGSYLKITDRKKDILVLGNGKNVAPQMIENRLKANDWIAEAALFGDGMEYVCALIIPRFELLKIYASEKGIHIQDNRALIEHKDIKALYKKEIAAINKNLASFEKIKKYELLPQNFSIESGELTPSMKIKRKFVAQKYDEVIEKMKRHHHNIDI